MEKQKLNTTTVYILSVISFLCCCFGGLGIILSGIAYYLADSKLKEVNMNPEEYENIQGMKTAKTVALVALIVNALYMIWTIYRISTIGWDEIMEQSRVMMEQNGWGQ